MIRGFHLFSHQDSLEKRRNLLDKAHYSERFWAQDPSLWSPSLDIQKQIKNCLGWIPIARLMLDEKLSEITAFNRSVKAADIDTVVCLGMGGSSLAPLVFGDSFSMAKSLRLFVVDTTDPTAIQKIESALNLEKTLFVVASKSGTTIESSSLHEYFYQKMQQRLGGAQAGAHFIAITDDKTALVALAKAQNFRHIFINPSDIGGRFSALSFFGLVIADLIGVDLTLLLKRAVNFDEAAGLSLGIALAELALQGLDKVTLLADPALRTFSLWVEQLVAESSGKNGKGLIPISDEPIFAAADYSQDRLFVRLSLSGNKDQVMEKLISDLKTLKLPVIEMEISQPEDLGHEFFLWEFATALAGHLMQFNPFDQPDVQTSKEQTSQALAQKTSRSSERNLKALKALLDSGKKNDYVALMAFVAGTDNTDQIFQNIRKILTHKLKLPTTFGYGPRFLHSTGQLHKGGPNNCLCVQFTSDYEKDLLIPGKPFSFADLIHAQALGDFKALQKKERRIISLHLGKDIEASLKEIENFLSHL